MALELTLHPDSAAPDIRIDAHAERSGAGGLVLRFLIAGDVESILLPAPAPPERADGLWHHTCFEAFVRAPGDPGYFELNLSPSGQWAAYRFSDYRMAMAAADDVPPPTVEMRSGAEAFELSAVIDLDAALGLLDALPWQLGLAAVVEDRSGRLSHWALAHPPGAPDFHHEDCFVLELPPPQRR